MKLFSRVGTTRFVLLAIPLSVVVVGAYWYVIAQNSDGGDDTSGVVETDELKPQEPAPHSIESGDLIFLATSGDTLETIAQLSGATRGYNHVGVAIVIGDEFYVYEVRKVVQFTTYQDWVENKGKSRNIAVYRLEGADSILTSEAMNKLIEVARRYEGVAKDTLFQWTSEAMYNAELVWKLFDEALDIQLCGLSNPLKYNVVKSKLSSTLIDRRFSALSLSEKMVLPVDLIKSTLLQLVLVT